jgi:hypothetical protein
LNDAVKQHQEELDHVSNLYSTALTAYKNELENVQSINTGTYQTYAAALADMYTAVEGAPLKEQQRRLYEAQILGANAQAAADAAKSGSQSDLITQGNKLEGYVWTTDHMPMPGLDLVKTINDFADDPAISEANIVQTYSMAVNNYLNAPTMPKTTTNPGLSFSDKMKVAEDAIRQFVQFVIARAENPSSVVLGESSAQDIVNKLASQIGYNISSPGKAPQFMAAVETLATKGLFGGIKATPTVDQFVKTVTQKTGDPLDESMARVIYAVFQRFVADGGAPQEAVNDLLYSEDGKTPLSTDQFSQNLGTIYAANIYKRGKVL